MIAATRRGAGDGWGGLTGGFWSFSFVSVVTLERQDAVLALERGKAQKINSFPFLLIESRLHACPETGRGDGTAGATASPSVGLRFWGYLSKSYPQILRTRQLYL